MNDCLRRAGPRSREGSVVLIATDNSEERECLCEWGASVGLSAHVIPIKAFSRSTGSERNVVMRIGLYNPEARRSFCPWRNRTVTIYIFEGPWDRACQVLAPQVDVDCICRPFARSELLWRAERALCRVLESSPAQQDLRVGPMCYDLNLCEVRVGTALVSFRRAERDILVYLLRHPHRYVTTAELQDAVLRSHGNGGAVRTQIYEIRRKLARLGAPNTIHCEPRRGYRLLAAGV